MSNEHSEHDPSQDEQPIVPKSLFSAHWEEKEADGETSHYSQFSIIGLIAFSLGLLSLLSFLFVQLLFLAGLGILLALWAVFSIWWTRGTLRSYFFACSAIFFAVFSLAGVSAMHWTYNHQIEKEGDRFFQIWFQAIQEKNLPLIYEMRGYTWDRSPYHDLLQWWEKHLRLPKDDMNEFVHSLNNNILRTLWELGDQAKYTLYGTPQTLSIENNDYAIAKYAVTYTTKEGSKETFFIRIKGERVVNPKDRSQRGWCLHGAPVLIPIPSELKKTREGATN